MSGGFIAQTTGITLPGISTTVVIIHVFVNRSINYHLESRTKISADISTPGSLYLLTGDSKCLYKSLCLCGFLMATEFMQHLNKKLSSTKGFWAWSKNRGQKMQGYFLNARLCAAEQPAACSTGCGCWRVCPLSSYSWDKDLQIPPDRT